MVENVETAMDRNITDGRNQSYAKITSRYPVKEILRIPISEVKRKEKKRKYTNK